MLINNIKITAVVILLLSLLDGCHSAINASTNESVAANINEHQSDKFQRYNEKISNSVFKILFNDQVIGTAFYYQTKIEGKKYDFILTATHTIEGYEKEIKKIRLKNNDNVSLKFKGHQKLKGIDVSIIFLESYDSLAKLSPIESDQKTELAELTYIYSYNNSTYEPEIKGYLILSTGYIIGNESDKDKLLLYLNMINKGGSGSPVLITNNNKVVGLITRQIIDQNSSAYTGITYAISMDKINILLSDYIKRVSLIK